MWHGCGTREGRASDWNSQNNRSWNSQDLLGVEVCRQRIPPLQILLKPIYAVTHKSVHYEWNLLQPKVPESVQIAIQQALPLV